MSNKLRIIAGEWRSRVIVFDDAPGLRPTPAKVRETLFNWLQTDIAGSRCLDLFAGSGALGFEAASRGAKRVLQVEQNAKVCDKLKANCAALAAEQISIVQADAHTFIGTCQEQFDLIFLDPPFNQDLIQPICHALDQTRLLAEYGKIYIETERKLSLDRLPSHWRPLRQKIAGDVSFNLYQNQ